MLTSEESAHIMLKGVACNKAVIAFPGYVHFLYWMERYFPRLSALVSLRIVRQLRAVRK